MRPRSFPVSTSRRAPIRTTPRYLRSRRIGPTRTTFAAQPGASAHSLPGTRARVAAALADLLWDDPAARPRARDLVLAARAFHAARGDAGAARTGALDTWLSGHPAP